MKKRKYLLEFTVIFICATIISYYGNITKTNYHQPRSDYSLTCADIGMSDYLHDVSLANQYYRIMDSTNIKKMTYYNFDKNEKIEVLNHCHSIGWAFAKIESIENKVIKNRYRFVPIRHLHETLPEINACI